jgi:imidazole glycerol phosphate synthase glutamine amidotransferase subunit
MIGVIDIGISNLKSVTNALEYLGADLNLVRTPYELSLFERFVLPGVGSFDAGVLALKERDLYFALQDTDWGSKSIFGICLGMQLLCESSEEGSLPGLGLIPSSVSHLGKQGCMGKIPHVGFNEVIDINGSDQDLGSMLGHDFYFVHSFGVMKHNLHAVEDYVTTNYEGVNFVSALKVGNVSGTQFHPEKSGLSGLKLLKRALKC